MLENYQDKQSKASMRQKKSAWSCSMNRFRAFKLMAIHPREEASVRARFPHRSNVRRLEFSHLLPKNSLVVIIEKSSDTGEDIADRPAFAHSGPSSWKMVRRIESTRSLILFPIFAHFNIYGALGLRWENPNSCNDTYGTEITLAHPSHEFRTSIWRNVVQVVGPNPIMQFQLPSIK